VHERPDYRPSPDNGRSRRVNGAMANALFAEAGLTDAPFVRMRSTYATAGLLPASQMARRMRR